MVVVAVDAVGRVAVVAPHELHRRAVDRHERHAGLADERAQVLARAQPKRLVSSTQVASHPRVGERRGQPRGVGALGQPEATAPALAPKRARWASIAGLDLQRARPRRWPAAAARRGWPRRSTARTGASAPSRSPPRAAKRSSAPLVVASTSVRARARGPRVRRRAALRVLVVGVAAHLPDERAEALRDPGRFELVAEHRRQRQRQRGAARRAGRAAAGSSRPSPPTATPRRTATCRSPRRRACACAARSRARRARRPRGSHYRHTATKSSARSRSACPRGRRAKSAAAIAGVNQS